LALSTHSFELEFETIRYLGNARSSEEYRAELDTYRSAYRKRAGIFRSVFAVRLSGRRLIDLASKLMLG
jgi:hypothetical protein